MRQRKSSSHVPHSEIFIYYIISTENVHLVKLIGAFLISYLITGSIAIAASIGSIEVLTKMFLYYFHERVWDRISFGRN